MNRRSAWPDCTAAVFLSTLNGWVAWRLFRYEQLDVFASVEGFWIALTRGIAANWGGHAWWPLWYGGMPFENTYVPFVPMASGAIAHWTGVGPGRAYHIVAGIGYALGPIAVYVLARVLTRSRMRSFLSALFFSLVSPSAILFAAFRQDIGGWWNARRLRVLVSYGEGPHVISLVFACLALAACAMAIEKRSWRAMAAGAVAVGLLIATNIPGSVGFGLALFSLLVTMKATPRSWWVPAVAMAGGCALAVFAVPPQTLLAVARNSATMHTGFGNAQCAALVLLLAAVAGLGPLLHRFEVSVAMRFGIVYAVLLTVLVATADENRFELIPQAGRLHVELEIALCLIAGCLAGRRTLGAALIAVLLVQLQLPNYRRYARLLIQPADVTVRSEYDTAAWLASNAPGAKVYATGSTSYWLNTWTDNPQFSGCCDQNMPSRFFVDLAYMVHLTKSARDADLAALWLRAYGVHYLVASGPDSTDAYKSFTDYRAFGAALPVAHEGQGNAIYRVADRMDFVHLVDEAAIVRKAPSSVADVEAVRAYVRATQAAEPIVARWEAPGRIAIRAERIADRQVLSVQVTWYEGWTARASGRPVPVDRDGLGHIVLRPKCGGPCEIELRWK